MVPLFYRTCGVEPPATLQGVDVRPALADPSATLRDVVFSENLGSTMAFDGRHKYVQYVDGDFELYDLEADPDEVINLSASAAHGADVSRMRGHLVDHMLRNNRARARLMERPAEPQRAALNAGFSAGPSAAG